MSETATSHLVIGARDPGLVRREVSAALVSAGFEVRRSRTTPDGFRLTGVRGGHAAATVAASTPLALAGHFSRSRIDVRCQRDLNGRDELHLYLRVGALRELDDESESNWVTRGVGELVGDGLQIRRVLEQIVRCIEDGEGAPLAPAPERPGTKEERREALRLRMQKGNRRRNMQILLCLAVIVAIGVLRFLLRN